MRPDRPPRHGERTVDDLRRQSGKGSPRKCLGMDAPFISGRMALADASELLSRFGDDAGYEAAARADMSRDAGNVVRPGLERGVDRGGGRRLDGVKARHP